jgi:PKD repeat protein
MKKLLLSFIFLSFFAFSNSQNLPNPANDTTAFPYWIQMMQDPNANFFQTQRAFNLYWQNRKVTKGCGWKVFKRWEYMMQSRVSPDGTRPSPESTYEAYMAYKSNTRSANGNWISYGPSQVPNTPGYEGLGRLNVVAFHPTDPDKLFVGSPAGGMWQSTDGGLNWVSHTDSLPTLGVSAILVDKNNPNTIWIGTGDRDAGDAPGMGVFKSTDGGLTWIPWSTGMGDRIVGKLLQHPTNTQTILAATNTGVYRSINGGSTWTLTQSGDFKDMAFKPNDPNIVYAASGADFYRSANNGSTFVKISSGLTGGQRGVIAVTAANANYVYFLQSDNSSGFKGVYRSTDAGLNFSTMSTTPNLLDWSCDGSGTGGQGWYDLSLAADPLNMNTIYVGGVDVWKSVDGGVNFVINSHWYGGCSVPAVHADCHMLIYSPVNGNLFACNDGGIYKTANGGQTWIDLTETMTIGEIYKLGQSQTVKDKVINGFQDNGSYTWIGTSWLAAGGGDGMECAIDYNDAAWTYYTIYYGDIYRKYNNGSENHIAGNGTNGITESGGWVTPFTLSESSSKMMFVGYKNIWRAKNVQVNNIIWKKISDNLNGTNNVDMSAVEHCPANTNIFYAVRSDNRLYRTDNCMDDAPVWIDLSGYLPSSGTATDIECHPTDENTVYMTLNNNVYKSTDKGLSWTDISGTLPNIHISSIAYYNNALEGLYIATDAGVYYKDSSLSDWIPFSQGLPANGRVTEVEIYYDSLDVANDAIRASTFGRGLWGSDMYHGTPDADFTANKTTIPLGCSINFTDLSGGVPTSWNWTFEGAVPASSNVKNPAGITYPAAGTFNVKLVISNINGADSITRTGFITVSSTMGPVVDFTADKTVLCNYELVTFTDLTDNCPTAWTWEFTPNTVTFKDGTDANSENPVVLFNQPGTYDVKLTAQNGVGTSFTLKSDYILYGGYLLPFEESFENGFAARSWTVVNSDQNITWDTITVAGAVSGTKSVWMNYFDYNLPNKRDQLISPPISLSGMATAALTFRHAYAQRGTLRDSLIVYISPDCGTNWIRLLSLGPDGSANTFVTHEPLLTEFYPTSSNDWCGGTYGVGCYNVDLTMWAGMPSVKLMFESYNRKGNNLFLDDISVSGLVGIQNPNGVTNQFSIYPNPTTGKVSIMSSGTSSPVSIMVYNLQGQVVYSESATLSASQARTIDLGQMVKGVYFIKVISDKVTEVEKIILE